MMMCDYKNCSDDAIYEITVFCSQNDIFQVALCNEHEPEARHFVRTMAAQYDRRVEKIKVVRRVAAA
jgi:hypothetical protein